MQRPKRGSDKYNELLEDFVSEHDFIALGKKYGVDRSTMYRWFSDEDVAKDRDDLIRKKQRINFNMYYKKLPEVIKARMDLIKSKFTEPEVKRKAINDVLEDSGQRTKQIDTQVNVNVNPFDGEYDKWKQGERGKVSRTSDSGKRSKTRKD